MATTEILLLRRIVVCYDWFMKHNLVGKKTVVSFFRRPKVFILTVALVLIAAVALYVPTHMQKSVANEVSTAPASSKTEKVAIDAATKSTAPTQSADETTTDTPETMKTPSGNPIDVPSSAERNLITPEVACMHKAGAIWEKYNSLTAQIEAQYAADPTYGQAGSAYDNYVASLANLRAQRDAELAPLANEGCPREYVIPTVHS